MSRLKFLALALGIGLLAQGLGCETESPTAPPDPVSILAPAPEKATDASTLAEPVFDPDDFVRRVDNKFFPLVPGTKMIYKGESEGTPIKNVVQVLHRTKRILGVRCTIVRDRAYEDGVLFEDTFDWFAQDECGNVWYFGEDAKFYDENGELESTEGSWMAGVDGAEPGILMLASPRVGDSYQQENAPGVAEGRARVVDRDAEVRVPYGEFENVLVIEESSPQDPGTLELKYYAKGVGFIKAADIEGGDEVTELVRVTRHRRHKDNDDDDD